MPKSADQYEVLQGEISQLRKADIHVHYLENIKQEQRLAGAVAMIQAAAGQAGAVLSAQAVTDEGDPAEGFRMQVDGKTVQGGFWKVSGPIRNLKVARGNASFVFTDSDQARMGVIAIAAAVAGLSRPAIATAANASGVEEEVKIA